MNGEEPDTFLRREMKRLLGPFDPGSTVFRDVERINRALGEGFVLIEQVLGPQNLLDRIEALHPDQAPLRLRKVAEGIMNLPRQMWELRIGRRPGNGPLN